MNKIVLSGSVASWGISAEYVRQELESITGDVEIHCSSYGGDFYEAMEIFNIIKEYSKKKGHVTTINTSKVMSAMTHIFLAGDTRKAYANSTFMGHCSWTYMMGDTYEMQREARILDGIDDIQAKIYGKFQNKTHEQLKTDLRNEMWYIGEKQLLESGFVDEILESMEPQEALVNSKNSYKAFVAEYKAERLKHDEIVIDLAKIEGEIAACNGNCTLVENPSSEKKANDKGNTVTNEKLQADLQAANNSIEARNAEMEVLQAEIKTLKEQNEKLASGINEIKTKVDADIKASKESVAEIISQAFEINADKDTTLKMVELNNSGEAAKIALAYLTSKGATFHGERLTETSEKPVDEDLTKKALAFVERMGA